jgi:hypothetical protein
VLEDHRPGDRVLDPPAADARARLGGALGLAVLGTLAASHTARAGGSPLEALTAGFQLAFVIGALLCLAGALVAGLLLRHPRQVTLVEAAEAQEIDALAA